LQLGEQLGGAQRLLVQMNDKQSPLSPQMAACPQRGEQAGARQVLAVQTCDPQSALAPQRAPRLHRGAQAGGAQTRFVHTLEPQSSFVWHPWPSGHELGPPAQVILTVCCAVAVLPAASLAVQVTVVTPIGNVAGALLVTVTAPGQKSVAVAVPMLGVVPSGTVIGPGTNVNVGGVWSSTVTFPVHVAESLVAEVAVSVTVVVPRP